MPFDAIFLSAVLDELRPKLIGVRVEKIQQPARDTVLLLLRGKDKLLLSANVNRPRLHLTDASFENPAQPPMFCMLLRKHLTGGRIAGLRQPPAERSVQIDFDCTDEMGVPCRKQIYLELMGRNSNLILCGEDGRIIDCLRRVDFEMSEQRQVLPGLFYHEPPRQDKKIPQETTLSEIQAMLSDVEAPKHLNDWLISNFAGLSPLIARELTFDFCGDCEADILTLDRSTLARYLTNALRFSGEKQPLMLLRGERPGDFTFCDIRQYGDFLQKQRYPTFSALLDGYYTETDNADRMRQKSQSLRKNVTTLLERKERKLSLQRREREATLDRERLRRLGDIVTANLYQMERGQTVLRAVDFYDETMGEIDIPLKPNLSPQQNAAKFYKDYTKAKHAEKILTEQLAQGEAETQYLAAVLDELSRAENERDLAEIRDELESGGYVRASDRKRQRKLPPSQPMQFTSTGGYPIYVGRNNRQNDMLSMKTARKDDLWLHVQKFHGTHVILACAGEEPPDAAITEAAMLAAYFSQAREGQNVPVDVTAVRNLRKPGGAKPGMVVYEHYRTVLVTPERGLPERLSVR